MHKHNVLKCTVVYRAKDDDYDCEGFYSKKKVIYRDWQFNEMLRVYEKNINLKSIFQKIIQ